MQLITRQTQMNDTNSPTNATKMQQNARALLFMDAFGLPGAHGALPGSSDIHGPMDLLTPFTSCWHHGVMHLLPCRIP